MPLEPMEDVHGDEDLDLETQLEKLLTGHAVETLDFMVKALRGGKASPVRMMHLISKYSSESGRLLSEICDDELFEDDGAHQGIIMGGGDYFDAAAPRRARRQRRRRGQALVHGQDGIEEQIEAVGEVLSPMLSGLSEQSQASKVRDYTAAMHRAKDAGDTELAEHLRRQIDGMVGLCRVSPVESDDSILDAEVVPLSSVSTSDAVEA